jgi:hypothetical protein
MATLAVAPPVLAAGLISREQLSASEITYLTAPAPLPPSDRSRSEGVPPARDRRPDRHAGLAPEPRMRNCDALEFAAMAGEGTRIEFAE